MTGKIIISIFDSIPLWVMISPILFCSVVILAVFIERMVFYKGISLDYRLLAVSVAEKLQRGEDEEAEALISGYRGPISEMMRRIVKTWRDKGDREVRMRDLAEQAMRSIEKFGGVVSTVGTVSPMLGLLGTVTGMMKSFSSLASMGPSAQNLLAQGITEALITTALGLLVAIPSIIFYNYMVSRVEIFQKDVEYIANTLLDLDA